MLKRIVTGLILAAIAILSIFTFPTAIFAVFIGILMTLAAFEWLAMARVEKTWGKVLYILLLWWLMAVGYHHILWALYLALIFWLIATFLLAKPLASLKWLIQKPLFLSMGYLLLVPTFAALLHLQGVHPLLLFYVIVMVGAADTGAYFAGSFWGRHRLAPLLSPKKSWEGFCGGLAFALILALIFIKYLPPLSAHGNVFFWLLISFFLVWVSVVGDLFESLLKRLCDVKDSGSILPGHGGILDRMDSLTAAAPIFALLCVWLHLF